MSRLEKTLHWCVLALIGAGHGWAQSGQVADIRYGRDIRPLLSDRCFLCHGPDRATQQADLRLDEFAFATADRRSGAAIVPGDAMASPLYQRLIADHPDDRMPPQDSGKKPLTPDQIELVKRWIDAGAHYEPHWAFEPLKAPAPPATDDPWIRTDIDRFVLDRLERDGLRPNDEADRETLCRRVYLDLTGLPPTVEELDTFLADDAPDAYDRLVDRLLTEEPWLSRHAERMATPWMDQARYADTSGIHQDAGRTIWPWRDWVLEAYRENMPFDQFIVEQLAGDLMPDRTNAQMIASGFNRNHVTTDEGGAINDEALFTYAVERTNTFGTVFLGLTVSCAQCHDHKFDPIRTDEYYQLLAFFNNNEEPGLYSQLPDPYRALEPAYTIMDGRDRAALEALESSIAAYKAERDQPAPDEATEIEAFAQTVRANNWNWTTPGVVTAVSSHGSSLTTQDDGSILANMPAPANDDYTLVLSTDRTDLRMLLLEVLMDPSLPQGRAGRAGNGNAILSGISAEIVSRDDPAQRRHLDLTWAWADHEQTNEDFRIVNALTTDNGRMWALEGYDKPNDRVAMFTSAEPFGYEGGSDLIVKLNFHSPYGQHSFGRVRMHVSSAGEAALAALPTAHTNWYIVGPFPAESAQEAYDTVHGPEQDVPLDFGKKYADKTWRYAPGVKEDQNVTLAAGVGAEYVAREFFCPTPRSIDLSLGSDDGIQVYLNGELQLENRITRGIAADQEKVTIELPAGRSTLVLKIVNSGGAGAMYYSEAIPIDTWAPDMLGWVIPQETLTDEAADRARDAWRVAHSPRYLEITEQLAAAEDALKTTRDTLTATMVMKERPEVRPTYVMMRGAYDAPDMDRPVSRNVPSVLGTLDTQDTASRLDLAQWLVGDENPLTARVFANRIWDQFFGQGLVETTEDFGLQGAWPSHPDLLDWLAATYRDNGWNTRELVRTIVLSNTYRQSSKNSDKAEAALLATYPRQRLTAEQLRDQALHVSGLLVEDFGGPSVKPYQPEGLWREVAMLQSNTRNFVRGMGDDLWRRSLYTYWKRAAPPPSMLAFDAPTREYCATRRIATNTPLQALVLWNDEQFVEAARATASSILAEELDDAQRLELLYRRLTGVRPSSDVTRAMNQALDAWRSRYAANPEDAGTLVEIGESPVPADIPNDELAAWTMLANAVLSSDAAIVKN